MRPVMDNTMRWLDEWLRRLSTVYLRRAAADEAPLRAELFSNAQLASHAVYLAHSHEVHMKPGRELLLSRLRANERTILEAYHIVARAAAERKSVAPADEWLLDNFYLIEDQITAARAHLPSGYSRQLPFLVNGPMKGFPRVYDLTLALVAHTDGHVDEENLSAFVGAYQTVRPLLLGELWAAPILLRLTLLENLRRVTQRIRRRRRDRDAALAWARRFLDTSQHHPKQLIMELADFVREDRVMSMAFLAELASSLHGQHTGLNLVLSWLDQHLAESGQTLEQVQQAESRDQAADQVSIGNSITSLRRLGAIDWRIFVEKHSATERILRQDPLGVYPQMDFATRDQYRHVVEKLARDGRQSEEEIAGHAVRLAAERLAQLRHGGEPGADRRQGHVGFFLIDRGWRALEQAVEYRPGWWRGLGRSLCAHPLRTRVIAALLLEVVFTAALLAPQDRGLGIVAMTLLGLVVFLISGRSTTRMLNWLTTLLLPPQHLPRLDFSMNVPAEHRTIVVVPAMLSSTAAVHAMIEGLELRYLGNRNANLHYVLLSDFLDSPVATTAQDDLLLEQAACGITRLNERYGDSDQGLFFLLHRPRQWNAAEGVWMGRERKRGKLSDFNRLVLTGNAQAFSRIVGAVGALRSARYVITLDTDTQLPPGTAVKLIGVMAHPLNRPLINPRTRCVDQGYGVLQPRTAISLLTAQRSWFARLFAGEVGLDPYTREVSHAYQDFYGRAQYVGKGIYDIRAFETAVGERFPDNTILSHDLIEGCHARCGFVNDIELIEDHPAAYLTDVARRQRWVRGDWQIAPWLLPRVSDRLGRRAANPLDALSRLLIFDNLRRSLMPLLLLAALVAAWLLPHMAAGWWTLEVLALWFAPEALRVVRSLLWKPRRWAWPAHLRNTIPQEARALATEIVVPAFLPYEAAFHLSAILRVVWRKFISHRHLLEWQTTHAAERIGQPRLRPIARTMISGPVVAIVLAITLALWRPMSLPWAVPLLVVWLLAPVLAWSLSRNRRHSRPALPLGEVVFLRTLARRTWGYFEHFAGAEQNWLAPDNYQVDAKPRLAERTSPTNIGLGMLSVLAAHDFGYLSLSELLERTGGALDTLEKLQHYRGHLLNWYDTRRREPLPSPYVSSVDSGNWVGCLIALRQGLRERADAPMLSDHWRQGLYDTLDVLREELESSAVEAAARSDGTSLRKTIQSLHALRRTAGSGPNTLSAAQTVAQQLLDWLDATTSGLREYEEVNYWVAALHSQAIALRNEVATLAPWLIEPETWSSQPGSALTDILPVLDSVKTLRDLAELEATLHERWPAHRPTATDSQKRGLSDPITSLQRCVHQASEHAAGQIRRLEELAQRVEELSDIDFSFLYDPTRKLLSIGFNLENRKVDPGAYDLLASEARLCSYVGVAQNKLPLEHWFLLGRQPTAGHRPLSLMSWSGSMFEYLMPLLLMPDYAGSLLNEICRGAVKRQMAYGRRQGVPWGISESCYNQMDSSYNYQYRAFGVPELGLKRGLEDDLVVAPYASVLALMVYPKAAAANLQRQARLGLLGRFGFFDAVDYTPSRVPAEKDHAVVRCFMAHHSGMSLLALAHVLLGQPMQRRFMADPEMRSAAVLLHERIPTLQGIEHQRTSTGPSAEAIARTQAAGQVPLRVIRDVNTLRPEVHLLGNGRYQVMITAAGGGYSRWNNLALTRFREDPTRDCWGTFFYVCDLDKNEVWSPAFQPLCRKVDHYEAIFSQGRAEFKAARAGLQVHTQIAVSPEDDIELRRLTLTNQSSHRRNVELTSYTEVVLMDARGEATHPAFHNLFVETQGIADLSAVLCTRRPRSKEENPPWMFQAMVVHRAGAAPIAARAATGETSFETSRAAFLGRGRSPADPLALVQHGSLSNTDGPVLDPSTAIRRRLVLEPGESLVVDFVMGAADVREGAMLLVDRYHDRRLADRLFDLAWTHSQVLLHQLRMTETDAIHHSRLAAAVIFANPQLRAAPSLIARNRKGQSALWSHGISGDVPIVLVHLTDPNGMALAEDTLRAHAYWRHKGLKVDLFIWCDAFSGYRQALLDQVIGRINATGEAKILDQPGGIFVRGTDQIPEDDRLLLQAVARVVLSDRAGSLREQIDRRMRPDRRLPALASLRPPEAPLPGEMDLPQRQLEYFNGLGGFTPDGREYVIVLGPGAVTPAPWINVLSNAEFGAIVSEAGAGYSWFLNAHEFRLTPWSNDPVTDSSGEAFYIRDEESRTFWSPTPQPARGSTPYVCRHGLGYSAFEHTQNGVFSELRTFVALDAPVRLWVLTLRNTTDRPHRLSVTGYGEWLLGQMRDHMAPHVVTRLDPQSGAILASNAYAHDFGGKVAFFQCSLSDRTHTCDRTEFIGRNGSLQAPAALRRQELSGRIGAGWDPCAAIQGHLELQPGEEQQVVFALGAGHNEEHAREILRRFASPNGAHQALEAVWHFWKDTLGGVYVETPDPTVNYLANHWLLYQTLACRFWGRSGFYQSGGAFGFRDQLQDAMAFVHECPWLLRQHLLTAAARQFRQGDVQHWWHLPSGRGVRTHFSDDFLWLPLATCRYVMTTGDMGVLDEKVPFLEGRSLQPYEESYYDLPTVSEQSGSLYEHCVRALRLGMRTGPHGLPLMGCGDWNDGMNRVGIAGQGESVWLAFFLQYVLVEFAALARRRSDENQAQQCMRWAEQLRQAVETHAWDGQWYCRAYFDDGTPLGSAQNQECRIDALPQAWAALSDRADPQRVREAMASVRHHLVDRESRLIRLLDPPFDKKGPDPGYIRGYIPGVRENGGQYTHAAVWVAMAFAAMGDTTEAWRLFSMINPIHHGDTPEHIEVYKTEPYVVAADVYTLADHEGRGGWTWYTGSAGWMYRLLLESLLGLHLEVDRLTIRPLVPENWKSFRVHYRFHRTMYHITVWVDGPDTRQVREVLVDDQPQPDGYIHLVDDGHDHRAVIVVGGAPVLSTDSATEPSS